jgi:hypothetical protein
MISRSSAAVLQLTSIPDEVRAIERAGWSGGAEVA